MPPPGEAGPGTVPPGRQEDPDAHGDLESTAALHAALAFEEACQASGLRGLLEELDTRVARRPESVLAPEDRSWAERIMRAVPHVLWSRDWTTRAWTREWPLNGGGMAEKVPGAMTRLTLFHGHGLVARLHLFEQCTEEYVHNHKTHFFLGCLSGCYRHVIYGVGADEGSHYAFDRVAVLERAAAAECRSGRLEVASASDHRPGNMYFLSVRDYHTVLHDGSTPVATIVLRGVDELVRTTILQQSPEPPTGDQEEKPVELSAEGRRAFFERLRATVGPLPLEPAAVLDLIHEEAARCLFEVGN